MIIQLILELHGFSKEALNEAVDNSLKTITNRLYRFVSITLARTPNQYLWCTRLSVIMRVTRGKIILMKFYIILDEIIKSGKIRQVGISNEKAWGTMRYLEESKTHNLPRMITIQNAYSLLNRVFEGDMAEIAIREDIGLLAYSPMAFGVLSGKYIKGTAADNARLKLFPRFARYSSEQATEATKRYLKIAEDYMG